MNKTIQTFITVFISFVLSGQMRAFAEDMMSSRETVPTTKEIEEAAKDPAKKEEYGKVLLSIFVDKHEPLKKKIECALALGRLKYLPAIPRLIEFIELQHPIGTIFSESAIEIQYPCVRALADYGEAAASSIVEAYAKEENKTRQRLLRAVVRIGKTHKAAIAFAEKLLSEKADDTTQARLKALVDNLMKP